MSFNRYDPTDSVISSETVVAGLWTGNSNQLNSFFTSSSGITNGFYLDVYNTTPGISGSEVQFDILFGDISGSAATSTQVGQSGKYKSQVIYGQYRNLVYGSENTNFSFNGTTQADKIYIINIARSRYKESLKYDSITLALSGSGTTKRTLTTLTSPTTSFLSSNIYYNLVSGSGGILSGPGTTNYGFILPDLDLLILDAITLQSAGLISGSTDVLSIGNLFNYISKGASFIGQSQETISSRYFFTRVKNSDFNYTTNPSIIDNNGNLLFTTLINNPQTFITTVGLYNDNNELLAVAKLSQPLVKDFTKEALLRCKLSY